MKGKVFENGDVKLYNELPRNYNGIHATYAGDFHLRSSEVHKSEKFYDYEVPSHNPETDEFDKLYFDDKKEVVTYSLKPAYHDLEELRADRLNNLSIVMDEFALLITRCKLLYGDDNSELNNAIEATKQMQQDTIVAINSIDNVTDMLKFKIRNSDVVYYRNLFNPFII